MKVELVDHWNNHHIDVMCDNEVLAEITPKDGQLSLSFVLNRRFENIGAIETWLDEYVLHLAILSKSD